MQENSHRSLIVLSVYVACFGVGAFNHASDFLALGWRPYAWGPPMLEVFWTALLPLDVSVAALILTGRRRIALLMAALIMLADVAANLYAWQIMGIAAFSTAIPLQAAFLGFVLGSIPFLWTRSLVRS